MPHGTHRYERRFILALVLTGLIFVGEVVGGLLTGSLALLSDAAHISLDMLALGLSYGAIRLAVRPPDDRHTYGYHRLKVLVALVNGVMLVLVAFGIFREAWERLRDPTPVLAGPMLAVAAVGLAVNLVVLFVLREHDHHDLNVRSAFLHVMGDTLASVGVMVAGVVILFTGWTLADPLVSMLIGVIIMGSSVRLLRESMHILAEGVPDGIRATDVGSAMASLPDVDEVHDLHVWTLSPGYVALSAHVVLADQPLADAQTVLNALMRILADEFGIKHTTIQLECVACGQGTLMCSNEH
jgi:cobalt-zinc-cadmium efflux system protein